MGIFNYPPPQTAGAAQPAAPRPLAATLEARALAPPPNVPPAFLNAVANVMALWRDLDAQNLGDDEAQEARFGKVPTAMVAASVAPPPPVPAGLLSTAMGNALTSWGTVIDQGNQEAVQDQMGRFSKLATALNAASIAPPPTLAPNANMTNILAQWAQLPPQQVPRFIADLLTSSNPSVVAIGYAIMGFSGQPSHANEVNSIARAIMGLTGQASHANEVNIIGHASMGFTGQPSHLNEAIAIGRAILGYTGRPVTVLGASIISIAMVAMGIAGHTVTAGQLAFAIERAWLSIWNLYKSSGLSGGF